MRREGRVSGYIKGRCSSTAIREREQEVQGLRHPDLIQVSNSWPRVKVTNKPTNESKDSGRCRRKACRGCHSCPPSKALPKTKGQRNKLSKAGLTFLSDPAWIVPRRTTGNLYLQFDPDCYSDCDSGDDYSVQDHDLTHYINGHCENDDDGAPVVFHENDHANGDDHHHVHDVCSHVRQKQTQSLGSYSQTLQRSSVSDSDDDSEWYQVVASDIESKEDGWYLC